VVRTFIRVIQLATAVPAGLLQSSQLESGGQLGALREVDGNIEKIGAMLSIVPDTDQDRAVVIHELEDYLGGR
jgi:hypothetical protein